MRSSFRIVGACALATVLDLGIAPPAGALNERATVEMKGRDGRDLGRVKLLETTVGILLHLRLKGLPPGPHGFHIHEIGRCEGDFESAGGIHNPLGAKHGFLNEEGAMAGDLPNIHATASGEVEVEVLAPFVTITKDSEDTLFDADGASLIIHEKADDYLTDPLGNSGARIACGVIVRSTR